MSKYDRDSRDVYAVKRLGDEIGYGHLMALAHELWARHLEDKGKGGRVMQMTHKHDVYFSPHSTEAHNLVMQIADYCNKRGIWYKISESTLGIGIEYGGNVGYIIEADRKTENCSEKPNKSEIPTGSERSSK